MAKVFLLSAAPENDEAYPYYARHDLERLHTSAEKDIFRKHSITNDPEEADLIIFVERAHATGRYLEDVRRHPLVKKHREKCFVCNSRYFGVPFLPGVYGCVRRTDHLFPERLRSGAYLEVIGKDHLTFEPETPDQPYLYSFIGSVKTWPQVRAKLAELSHPRGFFLDTSVEREKLEADGNPEDNIDYTGRYIKISKQSKFVLCPRGDAVSSMRLFESMKMGRAPVIIADEWVYPEGPDWAAFSVHIAEKDIQSIPRVLEEKEDLAQEMGLLARKAWEDWFSEEASFHRVVEWCLDIKAHRRIPESIMRYPVSASLLTPFHLRRYLGTRARLFQEKKRIIL